MDFADKRKEERRKYNNDAEVNRLDTEQQQKNTARERLVEGKNAYIEANRNALNRLKQGEETTGDVPLTIDTMEADFAALHLDLKDYTYRKNNREAGIGSKQQHMLEMDFEKIGNFGVLSEKDKKKYRSKIKKEHSQRSGNAQMVAKIEKKLAGMETDPKPENISKDNIDDILRDFNKFEFKKEFKKYDSDEDFAANYLENRARLSARLKTGRSLRKYFYEHPIKSGETETAFMKALAKTDTLERIGGYMYIRSRLLQNSYYVNLTKDMFKKLTAAQIDAQLTEMKAKGDVSNYDLVEFLSMARDLKDKTTGMDENGEGRTKLQEKIFNLRKTGWEDVHKGENKTFLDDIAVWNNMIRDEEKAIDRIVREKRVLKNKLNARLDAFAKEEKGVREKAKAEDKKQDWEYHEKKLHTEIKPDEDPEVQINRTQLNDVQKVIVEELRGTKYDNGGKKRWGNLSILKTMERRVRARRQLAESIVEKELSDITANIPSEKARIVDAVMKELIEKRLLTVSDYINQAGQKSDPVIDILRDPDFLDKTKDKNIERNYGLFKTSFHGISGEKKEGFFGDANTLKLFQLEEIPFLQKLAQLQSQEAANKELIKRLLERKRAKLGSAEIDVLHLEQAVVEDLSYDILNASIEDIMRYVDREVGIRRLTGKKGQAAAGAAGRDYTGVGAELVFLFRKKLDDNVLFDALGEDADGAVFDAIKKFAPVVNAYPELSGLDNVDSLTRLQYSTLENMVAILVQNIDKDRIKAIFTELDGNPSVHTTKVKKRVLLSSLSGNREQADEITRRVIDEDAREQELKVRANNGLLAGLCTNGLSVFGSVGDTYLNINNFSERAGRVTRDAIIERSDNLSICRRLWDILDGKGLSVNVLNILKNRADSAKALYEWYNGLDVRSKELLDKGIPDGGSFKNFIGKHSREFRLCGTDISLLGIDGQGTDIFTEGKDRNYLLGLERLAPMVLDRMLIAETFIADTYGSGVLTAENKKIRNNLRKTLRYLAGGFKDITGLKGLERKSAIEFNRSQFGVESFEEAMKLLSSGVDFKLRKDVADSRGRLLHAAELLKAEKIPNDTITRILSIKRIREDIASQDGMAAVENWMQQFMTRVSPLINAMDKDKDGYLLKYFCTADFEKTIADCLDNDLRTTEYWKKYREESVKKMKKIKSLRKDKTGSQAYDDALKYAKKLVDARKTDHADSVEDILKKGYTVMPRAFAGIMTSKVRMEAAVNDIVDRYFNCQKQMLDILNADARTSGLSQGVKDSMIRGFMPEMFVKGTFSDEQSNAIKNVFFDPEAVHAAEQRVNKEILDSFDVIGADVEKEYYAIEGGRRQELGVERDRDLTLLREMTGLLDTDKSIYFSMKKSLGGKIDEGYTEDKAKEYLAKVNEALKDMKHGTELTDNLKNFMAGAAYENRNKKNYSLKQELRFLIGIYRGQSEYFFMNQERLENKDNEVEDPQNIAERSAIYSFLNIKDHTIPDNAPTITKYERPQQVNNVPPAAAPAPVDIGKEFDVDVSRLTEEQKNHLTEIANKKNKEKAKQEKKEKEKKEKQAKKNEEFEKKHPEFKIPKLTMEFSQNPGDLDERFVNATMDFEKNITAFNALAEDYKTINNPVIKEEYRNFLKGLQISAGTMKPADFADLTNRRKRYFRNLTTFVAIAEEALQNNPNKVRYMTALRNFYRRDLSEKSRDERYVFDENAWRAEIRERIDFRHDDYAGFKRDYDAAIADFYAKHNELEQKTDELKTETDPVRKTALQSDINTLKIEIETIGKERIRLKGEINRIEEGRLENFIEDKDMGVNSVQNYYYGQKTQASFDKLIEDCGNDVIKKEFGKLNAQEKLLLAAVLSVTASSSKQKDQKKVEIRNINDLMTVDYALTNMKDVKKMIKAYLESRTEANVVIDYDSVIERLTGQIIQDADKLKIDEQAFKTALTIVNAAKLKKNNDEAPSAEELADTALANALAKKEGNAAGRMLNHLEKIPGPRGTYGIDSMDTFVMRMKEMIRDDLKRSGENSRTAKVLGYGHNLIEGVNADSLSKRLTSLMNDENKNDLRLFVLLMQDRTVLDYKSGDKAEAFIKGEQIERVNADKRDMLMGYILTGGSRASKLYAHGSDNMAMVSAIRTLLSFQRRDDCKNDGDKVSDYEEYSVTRGTAIDWELVKHAFEFMDELKTEERRLDIVRRASSKETIAALGSKDVKKEYAKVQNNCTAADFESRLLATLGAKAKEKELVNSYKRLNDQQKALFIKALRHRDILDISKANSTMNLVFGFERNYVNPGQRFALIDEYVKRSESEKAVVDIGEEGYSEALKSLLSTQIDDSLDFSKDENIDVSKLAKADSRTTVIDWKLFSNALQFVYRADQEKEIMHGNRALYETMGDVEENGDFEFDAAFLRRNIHTSHGRWASFTMSRVRENIKKYIPDSGSARTLLSFVLNVKTMNSLNKYIPKAGTTGSRVNDLGDKVHEEEVYNAKKDKLQKALDKAKADYEKDKTADNKALVDAAQLAYDSNLSDLEKHKIIAASGEKGSEEEKEARRKYLSTSRTDDEKGILISDTKENDMDLPTDKFVKESSEVEEETNTFDQGSGKYTSRISLETSLGLRTDLSSITDVVKNAYGTGTELSVSAMSANGMNMVILTDSVHGNTITISTALDKDSKHAVRVEMTTGSEINTEANKKLRENLQTALHKAEKTLSVNNAGMKGSEVEEITKASGSLLKGYTELTGIISIIQKNVAKDSELLSQLEAANKQLNEDIMLFKSDDMNAAQMALGFDIDAFVGLAASGVCTYMSKEKAETVKKCYKRVSDLKNYVAGIAVKWMSDDSLSEKITDVEYAKIADLVLDYSTDNIFSNHKEGIKLAADTFTKLQKSGSRFIKYLKSKDTPLLLDSNNPKEMNGLDPDVSPMEQLGIDNVFDLIGDYAEFFTNDVEKAKKAKTGVDDVKQILSKGSKIYGDLLRSENMVNGLAKRKEENAGKLAKIKEDYDKFVKENPITDGMSEEQKKAVQAAAAQKLQSVEAAEEAVRTDERLSAYTSAAAAGDIAKSIDIKAIGELTSLFLSKENAALVGQYSEDIENLKNFAAETYENFYKNNDWKEGLASVNLTALMDFSKKYADKNTAMKWIMRGVGGASVLGKGFTIFMKNYQDSLMLDGKKIRGIHDSKTKIFNSVTNRLDTQRTFTDIMGQYGIDELFDIVKIIGICAPSKMTSDVLIAMGEAKDQIAQVIDTVIPKDKIGDISPETIWGIFAGAGAAGGLAAIGMDKLSPEDQEVVRGVGETIKETANMVINWSKDQNVWDNLLKLKTEGILDITKKYDRQSFLNTTGRIIKGVTSAYSSMYKMIYTGKGLVQKGSFLFDYSANREAAETAWDITTEKILTKFENNSLVGGKITELYKSGALKTMVKSVKAASECAGNVFNLGKDMYSRYQISKGKDQMDDNDFEDEIKLLDALADDDKFLTALAGGNQGLTDFEKDLSKNALKRNQIFTRSGMDYAGTGITMDMVDRSLEIAGTISKYTLDPAGLMEGVLGEAGEWIKFFGALYRDSTAADDYFAKGPGADVIAKIRVTNANAGQKELIRLAKVQMGFSEDYENDMAFRTYIGRNIVQSILFSASKFNPMKGIRVRSELMLRVLGMEGLIGKTDMASAMQLYDRLIGNMGIDVSGLARANGIKTDGNTKFEIHNIYRHIPKEEVPQVQNRLQVNMEG